MKKEENKIPYSKEFLSHMKENQKMIQQMEVEEFLEREETVDTVKNRIKMDRENTQRQKSMFINEIKGGLGDEIKYSPKYVEVIERPWYYKIIQFFKKLSKTI